MKKREEKEVSAKHDSYLEQMKNKISGKGSVMATKRISDEYKCLMNSHDFINIVKIIMVRDNMYNWHISFNLKKYEISKELKSDFTSR